MINSIDYKRLTQDFLQRTGTKITAEYQTSRIVPYFSDNIPRNIYKIIIERDGKKWIFSYTQALKCSDGQIPTPYQVLAHLTKYDVGTYSDFCSIFGYERGWYSHNIYNDVVREYKNVIWMFGDVIDELRKIE